MLRKRLDEEELAMQEKEKKSGNIWLTVANFVVDKRKAILVLFVFAIIHCILSVSKTQVNQDLTKYFATGKRDQSGLNYHGRRICDLWYGVGYDRQCDL